MELSYFIMEDFTMKILWSIVKGIVCVLGTITAIGNAIVLISLGPKKYLEACYNFGEYGCRTIAKF